MTVIAKPKALEQPAQRVEAFNDLNQLSHAELFKILSQELKSAKAKAAYEILFSAQGVRDTEQMMKACRRPAFEEVSILGRQTVIRNRVDREKDWKDHLITILIENGHVGRNLSRQQLIDSIRGYNILRRYSGKNGEQVKRSTIKKWLSLELEHAIRGEALAALVKR